jgi:predicted ATPase/DNA-binding SARP family transcriptional activator
MTPVRLKLFGAFEAWLPGGGQAKLETRKGEALLAFLARRPGEAHERERLAAMFWGEHDEQAARHSLRQALASLRRSFDTRADLLQSERETVSIAADAVEVDVAAFEELSKNDDAPQLETALRLYRGPFLDGLSLNEEPFEEWLERLRRQLHETALRVALRLAELAPDTAGATLLRALELDPTSEEAHRRLMRAHIDARRYAAAIRQYHACAEILQRELDASPEPRTTALLTEAQAALARDGPLEPSAGTDAPSFQEHAPERAPKAVPNNLPTQFTSFVGREDDVASIEELLHRHRLVTLAGAGGAGKTRCALEVGTDLLRGSGDGVWRVELAPIGDAKLVLGEIASTLSIEEGSSSLEDALVANLKRKRLLLILDNCEHVIVEVRAAVTHILRGCPEVRILCTSRENLNVTGERVYRIPSLAVPAPETSISASEAARYSALVLFADRARAADARFSLTDENAPDAVEICRRLDGIPLAIELAAARVRVLSPRELALRLHERFRVLTGGDRRALPRHQTMRALIDWSHDLLDEDEQRIFRRLAIFPGSFNLELASAVCSDDANDEFSVIDLLASLVDKSLVQTEPDPNGTRYRMLESTHAYAAEKLEQSGEKAYAAAAYARACLRMAERFDATYDSTPDQTWFAQMDGEKSSWRATLDWAFDAEHDVVLGQRLVAALGGALRPFGFRTALRWVQTAQASANALTPAAVAARLDTIEVRFRSWLGEYGAARDAAERALARYRNLDEPLLVAQTQSDMGRSLALLGETAEGERVWDEALATARRMGARKLTAETLSQLATASLFRNDTPEARARLAESLAITRACGHTMLEAIVASNLAEVEFLAGDAAAAVRTAAQATAAFRRFKDSTILNVVVSLSNTAAYLIALGRYEEARSHAREALELGRDIQHDVLIAIAVQHLAAAAAQRPPSSARGGQEDSLRAARLFGYTDTRLASLGSTREYTEQQEYDKAIGALRDALGDERLTELVHEGNRWDESRGLAEALLV